MGFDALNRPTSVTIPPASLSSTELSDLAIGQTTFTYDRPHGTFGDEIIHNGSSELIGRLSYTESPAFTKFFRYTPQGHTELSGQNLAINGLGEASSDTLLHRKYIHTSGLPFAEWFEDTSRSQTMDEWLFRSYDSRGLAQEVFTGSRELAQVKRNANGQILTRTHKWSAPTARNFAQWSYDRQGRMSSVAISIVAPGQEDSYEIYHQGITWDYRGLVTDMTESFNSTPGQNIRRDYAYEYDTRYQLRRAEQYTGTGGQPGYLGQFTYDDVGRLTSANASLGNLGQTPGPNDLTGSNFTTRHAQYVYDSAFPDQIDRLQEAGSTSPVTYADHTYDGRGNLISRTVEGDALPYQYTYDGNNRLRQATHPDGRYERYFYDGSKRILVIRYDAAGNRELIKRIFDSLEIHYSGTGVRTSYRQDIAMGQTVARSFDGGNRTEIVYHNLQKSRVLTVKDNGEPQLEQGHYSPWGQILKRSVNTGLNSEHYTEGFNDKQADPISGFSYYGFRYYDPLSMTWNRSDPKFRLAPDSAYDKPRKANLYVFSGNNPISLIDPDGLEEHPSSQEFIFTMMGIIGIPAGSYLLEISGTSAMLGGGPWIAGSNFATGILTRTGAGLLLFGSFYAGWGSGSLISKFVVSPSNYRAFKGQAGAEFEYNNLGLTDDFFLCQNGSGSSQTANSKTVRS